VAVELGYCPGLPVFRKSGELVGKVHFVHSIDSCIRVPVKIDFR
jgi:hypothetical protein